jgi:hypothetical protein
VKQLARLGLAVVCVACLLTIEWWMSRRLEADAGIDSPRISEVRNGR